MWRYFICIVGTSERLSLRWFISRLRMNYYRVYFMTRCNKGVRIIIVGCNFLNEIPQLLLNTCYLHLEICIFYEQYINKGLNQILGLNFTLIFINWPCWGCYSCSRRLSCVPCLQWVASQSIFDGTFGAASRAHYLKTIALYFYGIKILFKFAVQVKGRACISILLL